MPLTRVQQGSSFQRTEGSAMGMAPREAWAPSMCSISPECLRLRCFEYSGRRLPTFGREAAVFSGIYFIASEMPFNDA